jgi:hypothetical protein
MDVAASGYLFHRSLPLNLYVTMIERASKYPHKYHAYNLVHMIEAKDRTPPLTKSMRWVYITLNYAPSHITM